MKIYNTKRGILLQKELEYWLIPETDWSLFINDDLLFQKCITYMHSNKGIEDGENVLKNELLKPIVDQEIWAAGVTYFNSKMARQEESSAGGGSDFYAKVYTANRPEIFFKSSGSRAVGHQEKVSIRKDSDWNVPEPELTLYITANKKIVGYTIGNDMSSRSIEGENPLYLPQAKTYNRSAALGPGILILDHPFPKESLIELKIIRNKEVVFIGETSVSQMVREFEELVDYLFMELDFPQGCFMMTGTGIIPPSSFTLQSGDIIEIKIENIGTLSNEVA